MDLHQTHEMEKDDALEAIFALNMGDFVTEHLISTELVGKISDSVNNPERLKSQLEELIQIYSLDKTLSLLGFQTREEFILYDSLAVSLADMLQADACHIFQTVYQDKKEHFLSLIGTSVSGIPQTRWNVGYDLADSDLMVIEAYEEGMPMMVSQLSSNDPGWKAIPQLNQDKTKAFIAAPMEDVHGRIGMMLFESYTAQEFPAEAVELAEATAKVFVMSLHLQRLLDQAKQTIGRAEPNFNEMRNLRAQLTEGIGDLGRYQEFFIVSLADAIDARNHFTQGHSKQVAEVAKKIAESMALNEKTVDLVYYAGLLGALGKIHVPQEILTKEEALTSKEMEALKQSPNLGVGLLIKMNFLSEVIPYVHYQKERWDGKDSPNGLSGKNIPLGARIVGIADAYCALTHDRPYRDTPMDKKEALKILQSEAGAKWDPEVVEHLAKI